jgi:hypothetical protein
MDTNSTENIKNTDNSGFEALLQNKAATEDFCDLFSTRSGGASSSIHREENGEEDEDGSDYYEEGFSQSYSTDLN